MATLAVYGYILVKSFNCQFEVLHFQTVIDKLLTTLTAIQKWIKLTGNILSVHFGASFGWLIDN